MTRFLYAALAAFALAASAPALAGDCHGDCANCPHKSAAGKGDTASKDAHACACCADCKDQKECKCQQGCQCDHCAHKQGDKAPKAPAKT